MKPRHLHIDVQPHGRRHARLACYDGPPTAEGRCAPLGHPWSVRADMVDAVVAWLRRGAQLDGVPVTVRASGTRDERTRARAFTAR